MAQLSDRLSSYRHCGQPFVIMRLVFDPVGGTARRRPPFFRTKKLALLGSTLSLQFTPWDDPSWTLLAHPCCRGKCKREPDWYFDMHRPECFRVEKKSWHQSYHTWLKNLQTPIFMQENWPEIPMAVRYPLERVSSEYRRYFTNHCAYMIALGMTEGVTHVGIFGCEYGHENEHAVQRDSLTYWLGRFEQSGGKVVLPPKCSTLLNKPHLLYGYESHDEHGLLVKEYQKPIMVETTKKDGTVARSEGTVIDMDKAEGRPPLMKLPDGMEPAWERSGHTRYA